jgi:hypothetical protein
MSTPHPHSVADLSLAPVLIQLERNLAQLRDDEDFEYMLALELNDDSSWYRTPQERAHRVAEVAKRNIDLHGWTVGPTPDLYGLAVEHSEFKVSVMFGKRLAEYIEHGTPVERPTVPR